MTTGDTAIGKGSTCAGPSYEIKHAPWLGYVSQKAAPKGFINLKPIGRWKNRKKEQGKIPRDLDGAYRMTRRLDGK